MCSLPPQLEPPARIFLYNIPFFTNEIAIETATSLLATGLFAGIKDSSGQYGYFERLLAVSKEKPFTLLVGNDRIYTRARQAGAHGIVSGVACVVPELLVALDRAIQKNLPPTSSASTPAAGIHRLARPLSHAGRHQDRGRRARVERWPDRLPCRWLLSSQKCLEEFRGVVPRLGCPPSATKPRACAVKNGDWLRRSNPGDRRNQHAPPLT